MNSYYIQRGKFRDKPDKERKGVDSILQFDYMGSAEFEFGALPKSLKELRNGIKDYCYGTLELRHNGVQVDITYLCRKKDTGDVEEIIKSLSTGSVRLKEYCDLQYYFPNTFRNDPSNDFWWDIENHFMFWISNENNTSNFKVKIK
jgi:hypothetical protein